MFSTSSVVSYQLSVFIAGLRWGWQEGGGILPLHLRRDVAKSRSKKARLNQRRRTRAALVAAISEAVRRGETPTVAEAAEAAGLSRATAYRYFTSQQALLLEVSLDAIGTFPYADAVDASTVESRVDTVIRAFSRMTVNHERTLRFFLMLSMEQWLRAHKNGNSHRALGRRSHPARRTGRIATPSLTKGRMFPRSG